MWSQEPIIFLSECVEPNAFVAGGRLPSPLRLVAPPDSVLVCISIKVKIDDYIYIPATAFTFAYATTCHSLFSLAVPSRKRLNVREEQARKRIQSPLQANVNTPSFHTYPSTCGHSPAPTQRIYPFPDIHIRQVQYRLGHIAESGEHCIRYLRVGQRLCVRVYKW